MQYFNKRKQHSIIFFFYRSLTLMTIRCTTLHVDMNSIVCVLIFYTATMSRNSAVGFSRFAPPCARHVDHVTRQDHVTNHPPLRRRRHGLVRPTDPRAEVLLRSNGSCRCGEERLHVRPAAAAAAAAALQTKRWRQYHRSRLQLVGQR